MSVVLLFCAFALFVFLPKLHREKQARVFVPQGCGVGLDVELCVGLSSVKRF